MKHLGILCIMLFFGAGIFAQNANEFSIYLIGDAGANMNAKKKHVLTALKDSIEVTSPGNSAVVFLGDNIYKWGLYNPVDPRLKTKIDSQLDVLTNYNGYSYFIPGNHDWNHKGKELYRGSGIVLNGRDVLGNEEEYINNYYQLHLADNLTNPSDVMFYPHQGSPGPVLIQLDSIRHVGLLIIDTQWFLNDGKNGCNPPTPVQQEEFFKDLSKKLDSAIHLGIKNIVIVSHHPEFTVGKHSMHATHIQDTPHEVYKKMFVDIHKVLDNYTSMNVIFASGHEHLLEYVEKGRYQYIVSGSSGQFMFCMKNKNHPEKIGLNDDEIKYAEREIGFFKVTFHDHGEYSISLTHKRKGSKEFKLCRFNPSPALNN